MLIDELTTLMTGRDKALFAPDVERFRDRLNAGIRGRRILLIGGAGSIGGATVRGILPFRPGALHVVDQNENGLAELVRDLRNRDEIACETDFRTLPLECGSPIMRRFLGEQASYDFVLNFAALKHVRSEKDVYSTLQMLDTNALKPGRLLNWLVERGGLRGYFCVSTDKAANPVNLMGASKRLMEHVIFSGEVADTSGITITSARFANVAFSDGSLLQSWLNRLDKRQPLAVPRNTRRYFISLQEASQICLLAAFCTPDGDLLIPNFDPRKDLKDLGELAGGLLRHRGYEPQVHESETAARRAMDGSGSRGRYPLLLTPLDTSGEKPYEEFLSSTERAVALGMENLLGVPYARMEPHRLLPVLRRLERFVSGEEQAVELALVVQAAAEVIPEFNHRNSRKNLDHRM
ncbi:MAG: polysaccharide biosynthesis protein [Verrucomicrobia bacterium]|nr:polysaccharide biosynthesis protein [Verrucomicrobiota bacterium]